MAGGGFFVAGSGGDEEHDYSHGGHAVQWVGAAAVKGPKWGKLPLLTIGMLGIQCVWSIEMGYASPYLLELGLSKSHMSLVFMAGPLSGLLVQPLVGAFADKSRSKWGRRRPYMLVGVGICAVAMMLLGWAQSVAGWLGGGNGLAVAFAVLAIYCIDFAVNAVMATDRALVVDTLPPSQQEEGSAWGGRMFGFGSVLGFFVGNLDLTSALRFLGDTQIKILSFITSVTLVITHALTSWAVSERVLLRDDRPQSQSSLVGNMKTIWANMFTLPPGIQTICFIQFFNFLAWFPILFFTSVWVSEIYKSSVPIGELDQQTYNADAVRAGNRALFLQAIVTIIVGIGAPFLVTGNGVQMDETRANYAALGGHGYRADTNGHAGLSMPRSVPEAMGAARELYERMRTGTLITVPIQGLTLVKLWSISMALFAFAMACTWFTNTVGGAYFVIAITGVGWALTNWAPFSLLGELILIDGQIDRSGNGRGMQMQDVAPPEYEDAMRYSLDQQDGEDDTDGIEADGAVPHRSLRSTDPSGRKLGKKDRTSLELKVAASKAGQTPSPTNSGVIPSRAHLPSPLKLNLGPVEEDENDNSLVLQHSDDEDERDSPRSPLTPMRSATAHHRQYNHDAHYEGAAVGAAGTPAPSTAEKAGIILGIHNVYIVLPQFVVTAMSSIIFKIMEPSSDSGIVESHPLASGPETIAADLAGGIEEQGLSDGDVAGEFLGNLVRRAEGAVEGSGDAVGLIFRIGGISAAIGAVICWRLARRWERGQGI